MKNFRIHTMAIFITLISFVTTIESRSYDFSNKLRTVKSKAFTPSKKFGGNAAQGQYIKKEQTATITDGDTTYSFINIVTTHNPSGPTKRHLPTENLVKIGSFNTYFSGPEMPVTHYLFGELVVEESSEEPEEQSSMGSHEGTWAPIQFKPKDPFAGKGLVGNYFSSSKIATIHDPSGKNNQTYSFKEVESGGIKTSEELTEKGLVQIGSYLKKPKCNGIICPHVMVTINLYGKLTHEEDSSEDLEEDSSEKENLMNDNQIINRKDFESLFTFLGEKFTPASKFDGNGLIGKYSKMSHTAIIYDPSGKNSQKYTFTEVQSGKADNYDDLVKIGSYYPIEYCRGIIATNKCVSTNLYGKLVDTEN
jgi:hypothetical protein